ncbi:hypothetical protein TanjilG_07572 [Lupinus angustifolius]|uniref:FAF domain-containing protein n=1 Tax=Lupinus angustifolius TaxID=3871 RepID=A0A1J7FWX0_LUPAN|nr:PREDICTED: protein FANTASTIC FOUR 3-like [Lupinus angustifolius]OIV92581.1 hypothetical protein TanjilG_07572 [Lupinus angustifolius]
MVGTSNTIHHSNPNDQGGWNFLQPLSNVSVTKDKETTTTTTTTTYVHPQVKYYSSVRLSPKSLELCTEKLGSETGTDERMENETESLYSSWRREQRKTSQVLRAEKVKGKNFPPPLTTIRGGSEGLKMRPHREEGRLVIEVTKVPSNCSCFQAERSHGRLRLSFLKDITEEDVDVDVDDENENEMNNEDVETEEEEIEETEETEGDGEKDTCGGIIRIMEKYEKGRRRCKGVHHQNSGYGFDAVKIFQHLETLFIKL